MHLLQQYPGKTKVDKVPESAVNDQTKKNLTQ